MFGPYENLLIFITRPGDYNYIHYEYSKSGNTVPLPSKIFILCNFIAKGDMYDTVSSNFNYLTLGLQLDFQHNVTMATREFNIHLG